MELTVRDNRTPAHPALGCIEAIPFNLVSELLPLIISSKNRKITIDAKSQTFPYNSKNCTQKNEQLRANLTCEKVEQTENKVEITFRGTVKNRRGETEACSLYLYFWWDHTSISLIRNSCDKILQAQSLNLDIANNEEQLPDSIFELDIYNKAESGRKCFLGQGRGYLVFGCNV